MEKATTELNTERDETHQAIKEGVLALNESENSNEAEPKAIDDSDVRKAIEQGVESLNSPVDAEENPVDESPEVTEEVEADEVKSAIESGVKALNSESEQKTEPTDEVKSAIKEGVEALNSEQVDNSEGAETVTTEQEVKNAIEQGVTALNAAAVDEPDQDEVKQALEQGVEALNAVTDSDGADDTVVLDETVTEDVTVVATDDVKDAISAGVAALNQPQVGEPEPETNNEESKADILVIETPDSVVAETPDQDAETPETIVDETEVLTPVASDSVPDLEKSVDQAKKRSPTPPVESSSDEIDVVEPDHVETVSKPEPKETPVESEKTIGLGASTYTD